MAAGKAIVVGASSGIGEELVRQLAAQGWTVAALARRKELLDAIAAQAPANIRVYVHDVRNYDEVPRLFQQITKEIEGLDLIIYNSGVMPDVEPTEYDFAKDRAIFETNLVGAAAWLDQAAERFAAVGHGSIVGIGSVAGERGRYGQPAYNASKAGFHTYLEALRNRLSRRGVSVVTIKPGPVRTAMTANLHFKNPMGADEAARRILSLRDKTGEHYLVFAHKVAFLIIRNIPSWLFRRLSI